VISAASPREEAGPFQIASTDETYAPAIATVVIRRQNVNIKGAVCQDPRFVPLPFTGANTALA
jgi:hypothetical protein